MKKVLSVLMTVAMIFIFAYTVDADISMGVNEVVILDATTSKLPTPTPGCYIYTGHNPPYATPRSIQIYWPIYESIDGSTQGTSRFSFWAKSLWPNPVTNIFINGQDAGKVQTTADYSWVTINFPTSYLDQGVNNMIEIWTSTTDVIAVACDAPNFDDVAEQNAFYIRNNGGSASDVGPLYGEIYAKIEVHIQQPLPAFCDIQMSQANYINGETVTAQVLRIANPTAAPIAVELKLWFDVPTIPPVSFVNIGANGDVALPAGFNQNFGPISLFTVTEAFPRGTYGLNCRILHPVTGGLLIEDLNQFDIQ